MKKIDVSGWKKFKIEDVFMIKKPDTRSEKYYEEGTVNYVSSGAFNNGVMKCLKPKEGEVLDKGRCITVSPLDGSSFWQEDDFLGRGGSGASIALLYNDNLNQLNALFICSVIKKSAGKYGYANLLNGNNLKNLEVILPAITKYIPDFDTLTREVSGGGINMNKIDTSSWKEFEISELFNVQTTKSTDKLMLNFADDGKYDFVGRTALNNGVQGKLNNLGYDANPAKTFSVVQVGQTCCLYREREWYASQNIFILYPKCEDLITHRFFITTCINKILAAKYQDAYTYPSLAELKKIKVLLPAKAINEPDWQFMEDYIKEIQKKVQNKTFKQKGHRKKIDITTAENKMEEEWEKYRIGDLFKILLSKDDIQPKLVNEGSFPLVSSGKENNGICAYIEKQDAKLWDAGLLTVDMFGKAFYQEKPFYCVSHGRVNILIPKKDMSEMSLRFIGAVIEKTTMEKYDFQEMCTGTKLAEEFVFLPSGDNGQPDWKEIEKFMCSIADNSRDTLSRITLSELQDVYKKVNFASGGRRWKRFRIKDIFVQERGKEKAPKQNDDGDCPLIQETNFNNGLDRYVKPTKIFKKNAITISINYAQNVFFQESDFCASVNIAIIRNSHLNQYNGLFICSILQKKHANYDYTNKISKEKINEEEIFLPVDSSGNPDWDYMENYIKELITKTPKNIDLLSKVF